MSRFEDDVQVGGKGQPLVARTIVHTYMTFFSLQKKSSTWHVWQKILHKALQSGTIFGSEGLAINIAVYIENVNVEFLPLYCNWIASNLLPKFDEDQQSFVEPNLPNNKIGIMHLAAGLWDKKKDMRLNKDVKINIENTQGLQIKKSLRFGVK